jgi:hypothetical protein
MNLKEKDTGVTTEEKTKACTSEVAPVSRTVFYPKAVKTANLTVLCDEFYDKSDTAYAAQLEAMRNMFTFEKFDVTVRKLRDPSNHVCVLAEVTIIPTGERIEVKFQDLFKKDSFLKTDLNKYNNMEDEDFNRLQSKAQILYVLGDVETVDELPFFDEWSAETSFRTLYSGLLDSLKYDVEYIAKNRSAYIKDPNKYVAIFENNFRDCGKACLLFTKEKLATELCLGKDERFDYVMRHWKYHGLLFASDAQRCQIIYRVKDESRMHYAVVIDKALCERICEFYK